MATLLKKSEEVSVPVRAQDQELINHFADLNSRRNNLLQSIRMNEEQRRTFLTARAEVRSLSDGFCVGAAGAEEEVLEEVEEIEEGDLADVAEALDAVETSAATHVLMSIGSGYISMSTSEAETRLEDQVRMLVERIAKTRAAIAEIEAEMAPIKQTLKERFGSSINLEAD